GGHRPDRGGADGGGRRDRLPPAARLAPLLRPLHPGGRPADRRPPAHGGGAGPRRRVRVVGRPEAHTCPVAAARLGRAVPRPGRLPAVRRRRQPQAAPPAPGALRGPGPAALRPGVGGRRARPAGRRRGAGRARGPGAVMHHGQSTGIVQWAAVLACAATFLAVVAYLAAARGLRRRGDPWPWRRDACFAAGGVLLGAAMVAPLPGGPFTVHMTRHLLVGMAAPLPLVLARPLTLALRSLRPGPPRRTLPAVAHWRVSGWLLFPPVAAVLDVGGLWVLCRTPLLAAAHGRPRLHLLVHAHVFAAGVLFAAAICQLDPVRRRWGLPLRGLTLLAA